MHRLVVVRHGESTWNEENRFTGWTDVDLTEKGRAEAREAGWDDEEILEAIAAVAMEAFTAMVNVAGEIPVDGSSEASRALQAA